MKLRLILTSALIISIFTCFSQDDNEYIKFKNEGNAAYRNKDYQKALDSYEASLQAWPPDEIMDAAMVFLAADCARRLKDDEKSLLYYTRSLELDYKSDNSAFYMAQALKSLDREEEMEMLLLRSIEAYKTSNVLGHMKKMLVTHYLQKGAEHYNRASQILASATGADPSQYGEIENRANESFAEAKPWFEKALEHDANNENAVSSLKQINSRLNEKK